MGSKPIGYSASRISALIGLNQYQTPLESFQVLKEEQEPGWNATHGYVLPEPPDNAAIRWGLAFEDSIIKLAEEREGDTIIGREALYCVDENRNQKIPGYRGLCFTCHIDGEFEKRPNCVRSLHEGKTTNHFAFTSVKKEINDSLYEGEKLPNGFSLIRRWGDPGTDQVPQEYQVQAAVQRICTGAGLVKLTAMVFEKAQQQYEDMGWQAVKENDGSYTLIYKEGEKRVRPQIWADALNMFGNVHEYLLPSHPQLEAAIIKTVQEIDTNFIKPGIPPTATNWDDVKRLLSCPMGTIIAPPELDLPIEKRLKSKCIEYSELTKELGSTSPLRKRKEVLKIEIMNIAMQLDRVDWTKPPSKLVIIDPNGGDVLATMGKDKNDQLSFRAKRAT